MIKAKKSLGQNFLIDNNILDKIVNVVPIKGQTVLEIGPGSGNLTQQILNKNPKKIIVIEKDNDLVKYLEKIFNNQIKIIHNDVLKINEKILNVDVEIDGGMNFENCSKAKDAGANILVSGSTIFKENKGDLKKNIEILRNN